MRPEEYSAGPPEIDGGFYPAHSIDERGVEDYPPQHPPKHPETGRFMSSPHPDHDGRDVKGRFLSPADEVDGWSLEHMR
jgi:hypothetical protein